MFNRVLWHGTSVALATGETLLPQHGVRGWGRVWSTESFALAVFFACVSHKGVGVVDCTSGVVEHLDEMTRLGDGYVYMVDSADFQADPVHPTCYFSLVPVKVLETVPVSKSQVRFLTVLLPTSALT